MQPEETEMSEICKYGMMALKVGQVPQKCNVSNQGIAQIYIYIHCMPLAVKRLIKLLFHYLTVFIVFCFLFKCLPLRKNL